MRAQWAYELAWAHAFLELPGFAPGFSTHLKIEGLNPAGSIKLKTARAMVENAEADGVLKPGSRLIESTSGNLGIALASVCAAKGHHLTLVTDPNANERSIRFMRALGAEVTVVTERDRNGGYLQTRIDLIHRRLTEDPSLVWLNQYTNPANPEAHRDGTAAEIFQGFGEPDWLFVGAGTGGTLMGCVEYVRRVRAATRVVAVDSVGSVTFGGPPGQRWIPGLGSSRRPEIFRDDGSFNKVLVEERDTVLMCRHVARAYGLLLGGSTGTVLAAVRAMSDVIPPGSTVLAISPDLGDRYLDSVYDDDWAMGHYGATAVTEPGTTGTTGRTKALT
ncbi:2,3-diaminopropionate biosynthesis protein SbnA [Streptomyces rubradiris]|uniref:2,3-diaminopropionate biosynthesis protein SbnA n=1 Tax=Streptomyces rubradiris TaxID=285531 RepID=A0ABQ3RQR7_STRRR|nr:2,3-diaminopropionate biosynthesis protein SbnA [Streptomyces rubradiris]GHH24937.1 2,3-diaminopropionate biosynthesis protein SbnA [Streptomyces rubradiris]GHI58198.1 2,3-diaminopropionate biosynthesis protein SbnA [Streptomyces rubradiris]